MHLRGRERAHTERAKRQMEDYGRELADISKVESDLSVQSGRLSMLISPNKNASSVPSKTETDTPEENTEE